MGMSAMINLGRVKLNYMAYYYLSLILMLLYMLVADRITKSRMASPWRPSTKTRTSLA